MNITAKGSYRWQPSRQMTTWWMSGSDQEISRRRWLGGGQRGGRQEGGRAIMTRSPSCTHVPIVCQGSCCVKHSCGSLASPLSVPLFVFPKGSEKIKMMWSELGTERRPTGLPPRIETMWKDEAGAWFLQGATRNLEQGWAQVRRTALAFAHHQLPGSGPTLGSGWTADSSPHRPGGEGCGRTDRRNRLGKTFKHWRL